MAAFCSLSFCAGGLGSDLVFSCLGFSSLDFLLGGALDSFSGVLGFLSLGVGAGGACFGFDFALPKRK